MKRAKFVLVALVLFINAASISSMALDRSINLLTYHAINSPVELTFIRPSGEQNEYQVSLINKMDVTIARITLKGIIFDSKDAMIGVILDSKEINLQPKESKVIAFQLNSLSTLKNNTLSSAITEQYKLAKTLIVIPYRAFVKMGNVEKPTEVNEYTWQLDYRLIHDLTPANISSFKKVQGKMIENESVHIEDICQICEWCRQDAFGCGNALIGTSCRSYACTQFYDCSCSDAHCTILCRPYEQCC